MTGEAGNTLHRLRRAAPKHFATWKLAIYDLDALVGRLFLSRGVASIRSQTRYLNLGCGPLGYPGWINADFPSLARVIRERDFRPDWFLNAARRWKCPDDYFDGIFTQHLIEHLPYKDAVVCLTQMYRTLKAGHWARICVPGLDNYLAPEKTGLTFASLAEGISSLTQHHGHKSVWTAELMTALLSDIGFSEVYPAEFGTGADPALVKDQEDKRAESLYIDARK